MTVEEPRTFLKSLKPIIYFNCFIGMGAYRYPNLNGTEYFCMRLYTIAFTLVNWTITYFGLIGMTENVFYRQNTSIGRRMYLSMVFVNPSIALTSPLLKWLQWKGLKDCLRQISILDESFQDILGALNDYRKQYNCHIFQVIGIVLATAISSISDIPWSMLSKDSTWVKFAIMFTLHYPIMVMLVLVANFCVFVGYLRKKFRDLNDGLLRLADHKSENSLAFYPNRKIIVTPGRVLEVTPDCRMKDMKAKRLINDKRQLLHEIRKVHFELCKLSQKINHTFGIQNLQSMGYSLILITSLLYYVCIAISEKSTTNDTWLIDLIPCYTWTLMYAFNVWIVNHLCWSVSNEAKRTGDVIYELLETRVDKELQAEIQEFGVQIFQNSVRFNACGFFTLDHTFVHGMIGSITTYLVILIQMSPVSNTSISNEVLAWNGTEVSTNK